LFAAVLIMKVGSSCYEGWQVLHTFILQTSYEELLGLTSLGLSNKLWKTAVRNYEG